MDVFNEDSKIVEVEQKGKPREAPDVSADSAALGWAVSHFTRCPTSRDWLLMQQTIPYLFQTAQISNYENTNWEK